MRNGWGTRASDGILAASACSIELAETATRADDTPSTGTMTQMPTPSAIDIHAHVSSPRLVELTAGHQGPPNPHNELLNRTTYRAALESVDARLQTMARQGIDMQVIS